MGKIFLKNMKFYAYHGCLGEEKKIGADYVVNLEVTSNLKTPSKTDRLKDAVDYVMLNSHPKLDEKWHDEKVSRVRSPLSRYDHYIDQLPETYFVLFLISVTLPKLYIIPLNIILIFPYTDYHFLNKRLFYS